jgi:hypothetical protein
MGRPCTVCEHSSRAAIDAALDKGDSAMSIAKTYGLGIRSVGRHKSKRLSPSHGGKSRVVVVLADAEKPEHDDGRGSGAAGPPARRSRRSIEECRLQMASDLLDDAERLRAQLFGPAVVHHWGSKTTWDSTKRSSVSVPVFLQETIAEPTFADKSKLLIAIGIAIDKAQLLSGQATSRTQQLEQLTPEQARERLAAALNKVRLRVAESDTVLRIERPAPREVIDVP